MQTSARDLLSQGSANWPDSAASVWKIADHSMKSRVPLGRKFVSYSETDAGWKLATPQPHDSWRLVKWPPNKHRALVLVPAPLTPRANRRKSKKRRIIIVAFLPKWQMSLRRPSIPTRIHHKATVDSARPGAWLFPIGDFRMESVMLEHYFVKPSTIDTIRRSWLGSQIESYVEWMEAHGYARPTVLRGVPLLFHFAEFVQKRGCTEIASAAAFVGEFVSLWLSQHRAEAKTVTSLRKHRIFNESAILQMLRRGLPGPCNAQSPAPLVSTRIRSSWFR
jgi:hypothetical protein